MSRPRVILITGAAGNLSVNLSQHLARSGTYELRRLDIVGRGQIDITLVDLAHRDPAWIRWSIWQLIRNQTIVGRPWFHPIWMRW